MIEMPEELLNKHKQLVEELKEKVVLHGAWVEDKKISVTYRYKGVNDKLKAKLVEDAKSIIKAHGFQIIETPYALEGKPRVNWDKGMCVPRHLLFTLSSFLCVLSSCLMSMH